MQRVWDTGAKCVGGEGRGGRLRRVSLISIWSDSKQIDFCLV